tara:strand:+ start:1726 stop:2157 length:432 start_codon:yes stop_codon:yes gene_type:complete
VKNTSTKLIEVLLKTIDRVGIKKTIKVLEVSQQDKNQNKHLQELIIISTCNKFGITEKTLLFGRQNIANRTNAIGVVSVLLSRLCKLSQREVSYILHKEPTNINKYIKKFEHLDASFKNDKELIVMMNDIESECNEYFKINKK